MSLVEMYDKRITNDLLRNVLKAYRTMDQGASASVKDDTFGQAAENGNDLIWRLDRTSDNVDIIPNYETFEVISAAAQSEIDRSENTFNNKASIYFAAISILLGIMAISGSELKLVFAAFIGLFVILQSINVASALLKRRYVINPLTKVVSWLRSAEIRSRVDSDPLEIIKLKLQKYGSAKDVIEKSGLIRDGDEFCAKKPHEDKLIKMLVRFGPDGAYELEDSETGYRYSSFDQAYKNTVCGTSTNAFKMWRHDNKTLQEIRWEYFLANGYLTQKDIDEYNRAVNV